MTFRLDCDIIKISHWQIQAGENSHVTFLFLMERKNLDKKMVGGNYMLDKKWKSLKSGTDIRGVATELSLIHI